MNVLQNVKQILNFGTAGLELGHDQSQVCSELEYITGSDLGLASLDNTYQRAKQSCKGRLTRMNDSERKGDTGEWVMI